VEAIKCVSDAVCESHMVDQTVQLIKQNEHVQRQFTTTVYSDHMQAAIEQKQEY